MHRRSASLVRTSFVYVFIVWVFTYINVVLSTSTQNCSSTGLHMSVWKKHYGSTINSWIERNIVSKIRMLEESSSGSSDTGLVCNTIQPEQTNDYMNFAEILAKENSLDLFDVDIVYAGRFRQYTSDLVTFPQFDNLRAWLDKDLAKAYSSTDGKSLLAFPWYKEHGILIWRKDLLKKHNYDENEPLNEDFTWERMATIAADIQNKESDIEDGYAWQGNNYEGLTCNIMEWLASDGITSRIIDGNKVTLIVNKTTVESFNRAKRWIGTISSPDVVQGNEITVKDKFESGKALFVRLWSGMYDGVKKAIDSNHPSWDIGVSFLPKGKKVKAATLGGWGISISDFKPGNGNNCRKENALTALNWMVNLTAQTSFYKKFQRNPTFNSTFIDKLCSDSTEFQVVCELNKQKKNSASPKPELVSRPDVSSSYRMKSKIIYDFVQTFLEFHANKKKYEKVAKDLAVTFGPDYVSPTNISSSEIMLQRMICVLNGELSADSRSNGGATGSLSNDANNDDLNQCQCGGSSKTCSLKNDYYRSNPDDPDSHFLNYVKRTENNMFFFSR
eukprot:g2360.t1